MSSEKKSYTFQEIKQKLVHYCVYQDRCHAEVEQKMQEYLLIPEAKEEILLFLIHENYLNEERFARSYTRGKFYIKKWGKNKIKQNLLYKGISEKLIQISFQEIDDADYLQAIHDYIDKLKPTYQGLQDYQKNKKIIQFLMAKGYEYSLVLSQIEKKSV